MAKKKIPKKVVPVKPFKFTPEELRQLKRRLANDCLLSAREGSELLRFRGFRLERTWEGKPESFYPEVQPLIRALARNKPTRRVTAEVLRKVYQSAWTAYENSKRLGGSEEDARKAALLYAQLPLEGI